MARFFPAIKRQSPCFVLWLTADQASLYHAHAQGIKPVGVYSHTDCAEVLRPWVLQHGATPWVLLVDHSEETFLFETMPRLRGAAKAAWLNQWARQQGMFERQYVWLQTQGAHPHPSDPAKTNVLAYALGFFDGVQPWLDALHALQARIRALYAPCLLARQAFSELNLRLPKRLLFQHQNAIRILVTPCRGGLRQVVLVGTDMRFSRVALDTSIQQEDNWLAAVYRESGKLREYLVASRIVPHDQTPVDFYVVSPEHHAQDRRVPSRDAPASQTAASHAGSHYHWLQTPSADLLYVQAALKAAAWHSGKQQLALPMYRARDQALRISRGLSILNGCLLIGLCVYGLQMGYRLWDKQRQTQALLEASQKITQQYQEIVKTFPSSPLASQQLARVHMHWQTLEQHALPDMKPMLQLAGQILAQHPAVVVDSLQWLAHDVPYALNAQIAQTNSPPALPITPEKAVLILTGKVQGVASHDLRGARDVVIQLATAFNQHAGFRAEIIKRPFDVSAKAHVSGSGQSGASDGVFEIKIGQH